MDSATGAAGLVGCPEKYCYILSMENKPETTVIKVRLRNMPKGGGEARQETARRWNRMVLLHRWFRRKLSPHLQAVRACLIHVQGL